MISIQNVFALAICGVFVAAFIFPANSPSRQGTPTRHIDPAPEAVYHPSMADSLNETHDVLEESRRIAEEESRKFRREAEEIQRRITRAHRQFEAERAMNELSTFNRQQNLRTELQRIEERSRSEASIREAELRKAHEKIEEDHRQRMYE